MTSTSVFRKVIFVTVGTTLFDPLIQSISNPKFLEAAALQGYTNLVVQFGKGSVPIFPSSDSTEEFRSTGLFTTQNGSTQIEWSCFRFKPSLSEDMVKGKTTKCFPLFGISR